TNGKALPRWRYVKAGATDTLALESEPTVEGYAKIDNITDRALRMFKIKYRREPLTKDDIFDYVYGVLHCSTYRTAYAADLKKMLPRIPFLRDFDGYSKAGKALANLHLG